MDFYKKIIKKQEFRIKILQMFNFIPDKLMIKIQYRIKTGRKVELCNPKRYTDKIQWYKLYYRDNLMTKCVDKYEVRDFVKERNCSEILNEIYGVWEDVEEINFEKLPNEFVLKTTNRKPY